MSSGFDLRSWYFKTKRHPSKSVLIKWTVTQRYCCFCGKKSWGVKQQSFDAVRTKPFRVPPIARGTRFMEYPGPGDTRQYPSLWQLDRRLRHCLNHGQEPKAGTEWKELQLKPAKRQPRGSQALLIVSQLSFVIRWSLIDRKSRNIAASKVLSCSHALSLSLVHKIFSSVSTCFNVQSPKGTAVQSTVGGFRWSHGHRMPTCSDAKGFRAFDF